MNKWQRDIEELLAVCAMMDAVIEGAQTDFVRVPYGASHEDVAQINEWHAMAKEARESFADARREILQRKE